MRTCEFSSLMIRIDLPQSFKHLLDTFLFLLHVRMDIKIESRADV